MDALAHARLLTIPEQIDTERMILRAVHVDDGPQTFAAVLECGNTF